jgi:hypothetical protein
MTQIENSQDISEGKFDCLMTQIKNPQDILQGSFDCLMTQIEKRNIMAKAVISGTIKIVIMKAINSIIFALTSIRWRAEPIDI